MPGHLALILHAHLPFVRHPEHEHFLEEDWLFEAITESYIPLLQMMQRLVNDSVPFKLTMSITPTLCAMLQDELLRERYVRHLDLLIDLAMRERRRNRHHQELQQLAGFYFDIFSVSRRFLVGLCNAGHIGFVLVESVADSELESVRQEASIRCFLLAAQCLVLSKPPPRRAMYAPCFTPAGPAVFERARQSSRQVWSAQEG